MAVGKKAVVLVVAAAVAAGAGWGFAEWQKSREAKPSVAWGSVDAREVSLAFEGSGRIAELLREEGEAVKAGDVIGRLDTRALEIERRRAEAQAEGLDAQWRLAEEGCIMDPKWVRAYVSETQLKYVQEGAEALVTTDTTEPLKARVGHISSEAEFTPKTVATQDLRTVLVYEVRLNVEDPGNRLRLGQPVTVDFAP